MRLIQINDNGEVSLTSNLYRQVPPYAILSHTWYADDEDEVSLKDMVKKRAKDKKGFRKIQFCADQARLNKLGHCWVDTCCIDKKNSVELDEAIRSMYRWYAEAAACYVYLSDVPTSVGLMADKVAISMSRWFKRGWTLQELLAPPIVHFFAEDGSFLGDKQALQRQIYVATGIPANALSGAPLSDFPITQRLAWASRRETKRPEDLAYCLLGIFGVFLSMMYGEGEVNAFRRLQKAILEKEREKPGPTALETALQKEIERQDSELLQALERSELEMQNGVVTVPLSSIPSATTAQGAFPDRGTFKDVQSGPPTPRKLKARRQDLWEDHDPTIEAAPDLEDLERSRIETGRSRPSPMPMPINDTFNLDYSRSKDVLDDYDYDALLREEPGPKARTGRPGLGLRDLTKSLLGLKKLEASNRKTLRYARQEQGAESSRSSSGIGEERRPGLPHSASSSRDSPSIPQASRALARSFTDAFQTHVRQPAILQYMQEVGRTYSTPLRTVDEGAPAPSLKDNIREAFGADQTLKNRMEDDEHRLPGFEGSPSHIHTHV